MFANMKIGTRLGASFGLVLALMGVMTGIGIMSLRTLETATKTLATREWPQAALASQVSDQTNNTARLLTAMLILKSADDLAQAEKQMNENGKKTLAALNKLEKSATTDKGRVLLKKIREARAPYAEVRKQFVDMVKADQIVEAKSLLIEEVFPRLRAYIDAVHAFGDYQGSVVNKVGSDARAVYEQSLVIMLSVSSAAVLIAVFLAFFATRKITQPLKRAVEVARAIAKGDLSSRVESQSKDETGQLLNALQEMNNNLASLIGDVRHTSQTIGVASREIVAGNGNLSERTEKAAASLEETAASLEELTSTVKQNADNARQANELAVGAAKVAGRGGDVVDQVVQTMGSINESSHKIVDIISVIDGIAFQTNILALNAAVEAARAGEQGRGFAVVASEVRNLAQRSAAAAKEIKTLIHDSVEKVGAGNKLVESAGQTMQEVVTSIKRVTDIMAEISAASVEQSSGIEQVNAAISQMDEVTQQNAALVEEATASSALLDEQAQTLNDAVAVFKLETAQAAEPAAATAAHPRVHRAPSAPSRPKPVRHAAPATSEAEWAEF